MGHKKIFNIGGNVPEFLSPYNDEIWYRAVLDYAQSCSGRRARQLARLLDWQPVGWDRHFAITMPLLD